MMLTLVITSIVVLTSFLSSGTLAFWAATSKRHWSVRAGVFIAAAATPLLIPVYEACAAFLVQGVVIAAGVQFARWRRWCINGIRPDPPRYRLSLRSCLLATSFIAIAIAIFVRAPRIGLQAWMNVASLGLAFGVVALAGSAIVVLRRPRWWWRLCSALVVGLVAAGCLGRFDRCLESLIDPFMEWPPYETESSLSLDDVLAGYVYAMWAGIIVAIVILSAVAFWLASQSTHPASPQKAKRVSTRAAFAVLVMAIVLPPAIVFAHLMNPTPIPSLPSGGKDGWQDLVAAAKMVESLDGSGTIDNFDLAPSAELESVVETLVPAYERFNDGLRAGTWIPLDYEVKEFDGELFTGQRRFTRFLLSRGRLAKERREFAAAAEDYAKAIEYGFAVRRGGLMVHSLVGTACSGMAISCLCDCRGKLSPAVCLELIPALDKIETSAETESAIILRDRAWEQRAYGWHGHLKQLLEQWTVPESERGNHSMFIDICRRERAEIRLLRVEFALEARRFEEGTLPATLSELVPQYLPEIPLDPFTMDKSELQYKRVDAGFVVYSVGLNGVDDGGSKPTSSFALDGDLCLDFLFGTTP
ncbi:MAG: hypothetical protein AAFU85_04055 [Planctomycetota bacterium]